MLVGVCRIKVLPIMRSLALIILLLYIVSGQKQFCPGEIEHATEKEKSLPIEEIKMNEHLNITKTKDVGKIEIEKKTKFDELRKIISTIETKLIEMNKKFSDLFSDEEDPISPTYPPTPTWKPYTVLPMNEVDPTTRPQVFLLGKKFGDCPKQQSECEKDDNDLNTRYRNLARCYLQGCCCCKDHLKKYGGPALTPVINIYNYNNGEPSHVEETVEEDHELAASPWTEL